MAYVVGRGSGQQDDDEQQQPTLSGGSAPMGGAAPPTTGTARPAAGPSPMGGQNAGRSGRFTNIQTILGQNKGIANQVSNASGKALGAAKSTFDTAANPLRDASFTANTDWRGLFNAATPQAPTPSRNVGGGNVQGGGMISEKDAEAFNAGQPNQRESSFAALKGLLTQDYKGPGAVNYNAAGDKNIQKAALLSDARTAGGELAEGRYSAGSRRFDQGLFSADSATQQGMRESGKATLDTANANNKEIGELNDKVTGFKTAAANARDVVRSGLLSEGQAILDGVQGRVDARTAQERNDMANGIVRDPNTGQVVNVGPGEKVAGWEAGTGANIGNTVNATEDQKFGLLRDLLGGDAPDVRQTGGYASGRNTTKADDAALGTIQTTDATKNGPTVEDFVKMGIPRWVAEQMAGYKTGRMQNNGEVLPYIDMTPSKAR